MKKLIVATLSALVLVVGGSAAGVSAQVVEGEPEIVVDNPQPAPGDTVTIGVGNLEPETEVGIELGDQVADGVADADGNASIDIKVPDEPGEIDGIVNINGVDYPISVVVAAVAEAEAEGTGDGTPQPTAVNTGDASRSSNNSVALFAAAAGLLVLGGGAMTIRRRSVMS
jgi:MYXO-CTERM domain-containing protein